MKLAVFKDHEIDEDGVATFWYYECYHQDCAIETPYESTQYPEATYYNYHSQSYLYWENALAGANKHATDKHFPQRVGRD